MGDNLVQDDGNTVDTGAAFYAQRSCAGIKSQIQSMTKTQSSKFGKFGYDNKKNLHTAASRKVVTAAKAPKDGPYFITTYTPGKRYQRTQVWCDMKNGATYKFIANSNKKTYPLGKQGSNSCSALGMRVWSTFAAKAQATAVAHVKNHLKENANTNKALLDFLNIRSATTSTTSYICVPASVVNAVKANHFATSGRAANKYQVSRISNAEVGKYVITYTVADKAGNTNTEIRNGRKYSMQGNVRNGPGVDCSKPNNSATTCANATSATPTASRKTATSSAPSSSRTPCLLSLPFTLRAASSTSPHPTRRALAARATQLARSVVLSRATRTGATPTSWLRNSPQLPPTAGLSVPPPLRSPALPSSATPSASPP